MILRSAARAAVTVALASVALPAAAQTIQLTDSSATVLRGGSYADTNLSADPLLATRASSDATYVRRIVTKFDTQNTIPQGTSISAATLTVTVAGGNAEARSVSAYRVNSSFEETETTWNRRNVSASWSSAGGDLAERYAAAVVSNTPGSRVTFNVTALVQAAVNGSFGSRYTRVALVDTGVSSKDSYKEYYSDEAGDSSVRPVLTVTFGGTASAPTTITTTTTASGVKLRVLQYNTHHGGYGTDGRYAPDRLATWMAKMKPDVIMLNEIEKFTSWGNEDQPAHYKALMESKTGRKWYYIFAQEFGAWTSNGKGHVILSTYPLEASAFFDMSWDRAAAMARITVNGRAISLVVTHLDPYSQTVRLSQAQEVVQWAVGIAENRILTGDMNAWPDQSSILEYNKTYNDSWAVAEAAGTAVSFSGLTPSGATKNGRIDYIMYSKKAANLVVLGSQVYDTRDANGVMPSDHRPVLTTFEVR